jgi:hypothetical protein
MTEKLNLAIIVIQNIRITEKYATITQSLIGIIATQNNHTRAQRQNTPNNTNFVKCPNSHTTTTQAIISYHIKKNIKIAMIVEAIMHINSNPEFIHNSEQISRPLYKTYKIITRSHYNQPTLIHNNTIQKLKYKKKMANNYNRNETEDPEMEADQDQMEVMDDRTEMATQEFARRNKHNELPYDILVQTLFWARTNNNGAFDNETVTRHLHHVIRGQYLTIRHAEFRELLDETWALYLGFRTEDNRKSFLDANKIFMGHTIDFHPCVSYSAEFDSRSLKTFHLPAYITAQDIIALFPNQQQPKHVVINRKKAPSKMAFLTFESVDQV